MTEPKHTSEDLEEWLKKIQDEREMIDDHGPQIIGKREKSPNRTNISDLI